VVADGRCGGLGRGLMHIIAGSMVPGVRSCLPLFGGRIGR
jgi:hypothetical protein